MSIFRSRAEKKLVERGLDPARLPPGQYLTEKWPVLHAGRVPKTDLATWDFKVFGEVENAVTLTYDVLHTSLQPRYPAAARRCNRPVMTVGRSSGRGARSAATASSTIARSAA